jgi:Flp pilus assembly protein TadD
VRRALELLLDLRKTYSSLELIDRNIASLQLQCGNYLGALASFDAACAKHADDPDAHYGRALALYRLHRNDEAVAALDRALELRKDFPPAKALRLEMRR